MAGSSFICGATDNPVQGGTAIQKFPDGSIFEIQKTSVALLNKRWDIGATINVHFLNGNTSDKKNVAKYASEWTNFANLNFSFHFGEAPEDPSGNIITDIAINFWDIEGHGQSRIGTDSRDISRKGEASMHLGKNPSRSLVLHEFGHALGLKHEHLNPAWSITWDPDAIYEYMKKHFGWSKDKVNSNIIDRPVDVEATRFDPESIMIYHIPKEWNKEHVEIPSTNKLSGGDKKFIAQMYSSGFAMGIGIAGSNSHCYAWTVDGTVSSGSSSDLGIYRSPYQYELPNGKKFSDIVGIGIARNDHCYVWYRDGTVSSGSSRNLGQYRSPYQYKMPKGKSTSDIVGIGIAPSNDHCYAWYRDGTVSSGSTRDLGQHRSPYQYKLPKGKSTSDIVGIGIAPGNDHCYAWYRDGTVSSGSSRDLGQYRSPYKYTKS